MEYVSETLNDINTPVIVILWLSTLSDEIYWWSNKAPEISRMILCDTLKITSAFIDYIV